MKLYLVPTPIGNLEDITLRALRILREEVDVILAEDTRTSGNLLRHYSISKPMSAFHINNEHKVVTALAERIVAGERMALVTDAGTPAISDPGEDIVALCAEKGIPVTSIPGACAAILALTLSGLPTARFCFEGFLPQKKGRTKRLQELSQESRSIIFYESPYRVIKCLEQLAETFGAERKVSVSRELTKKFEQTVRGTLAEVAEYFRQHEPKGEFVIVVAGSPKAEKSEKHNRYAKDEE